MQERAAALERAVLSLTGYTTVWVGLLARLFAATVRFVADMFPQRLKRSEPCHRRPCQFTASRDKAKEPPICVHTTSHPLPFSAPAIMELFEIAWLSSAVAFACAVYAFEPNSNSKPPEDLIPVKANGRDIRVPPAFFEAMLDVSTFATKFELALKKAVPELTSTGGSLWTARIVRGKKPELEKAVRAMDECDAFFAEILQGVDLLGIVGSGVIIQLSLTGLSTLMIAVR